MDGTFMLRSVSHPTGLASSTGLHCEDKNQETSSDSGGSPTSRLTFHSSEGEQSPTLSN